MESYKKYFSKALDSDPERLHFAAHSHHLWPDCTQAAQAQAWIDAATLADDKWGKIFGKVVPEAQANIAYRLSLPDPTTICFAPNTHEFLLRLHSSLPGTPSVLTTDAEFHSFTRQRKRWEEEGSTEFEVVPAEPFETFGARFLKSAARYEHDMIYISQVFFNSGYVVEILDQLAEIVRGRDTLLVIDGYHAFMALPVSLEAIHDRVFYIAGGYKYAMSGEGACFMHCPPGFAMRPVNTGWFAGFDGLDGAVEQVGYSIDGMRFAGATFDASGLHRFNAAQALFDELALTVLALHERVQVLQNQFLDGLVENRIDLGDFIPGAGGNELGHFLTFRGPRAEIICNKLAAQKVMVDFRKDCLRIGFGIYHDPEDVEELLRRLVITQGVATPPPPADEENEAADAATSDAATSEEESSDAATSEEESSSAEEPAIASASAVDSAIASAIQVESRASATYETVDPPTGTDFDLSSVDEDVSDDDSGSSFVADVAAASAVDLVASPASGPVVATDSEESAEDSASDAESSGDDSSDSAAESAAEESAEGTSEESAADDSAEGTTDESGDSASDPSGVSASAEEEAAKPSEAKPAKKKKKRKRKSKSKSKG